MRINNNVMAINSHRQLGMNNVGGQKSMEKLSSGYRVNRAGDDAAGLSISEKMRGQIRGLNQASRNAQDGISLIQTAEGAMNETHAILQRMRELAVQASNDTNVTADRASIQKELVQLHSEINRIATSTEFNTKKLLNSAAPGALKLHVGANTGQNITVEFTHMRASALNTDLVTSAAYAIGSTVAGSVAQANADALIGKIDKALTKVSEERSKLGAVQNRLEHTIKNLDNSSENLQAAESRVRDVDMAHEMMTFTKQNILSQAATAMLAQANMAPQSVLQLLG